MSDYSVQRLRGGFALVYRIDGKRIRRQLASTDRASAEAEARALYRGTDSSPWTMGRIMTAYLDTIAHKTSHGRRQDAWKAMRSYWQDIDPALIDEEMAQGYQRQRNAGPATVRYELMQVLRGVANSIGKLA